MKELTSIEEFESAVAEGVTLVDVYTTNCGSCKVYKNQLERIQDEINIVAVDIQQYPKFGLIEDIQTMSVPATFIFKDGKKVDQYVAFRPAEQVLEIVGQYQD